MELPEHVLDAIMKIKQTEGRKDYSDAGTAATKLMPTLMLLKT
jgi:hypothetical protein